jgi:hypothetical protein
VKTESYPCVPYKFTWLFVVGESFYNSTASARSSFTVFVYRILLNFYSKLSASLINKPRSSITVSANVSLTFEHIVALRPPSTPVHNLTVHSQLNNFLESLFDELFLQAMGWHGL